MRVDLRAGTGGHGAERDRIVAVERISSARGDDRINNGAKLIDARPGDDLLPALAGGRAATLVLRAPRPLPRRLTVALTDATCDRSGRLRPGGARWPERVEVIPLRGVVRVG
ncbi:MAG TPA: hypothetical protein VLK58_24835 [Conexibacter sp.]|nr:hypothetical protein [Conexibacter sp.]